MNYEILSDPLTSLSNRKLKNIFALLALGICHIIKGKVTPKQAYVALRGPGG
jgi:hypothetical protein